MTARFADHILEGDHASRPAATAVGNGTLYACSDHNTIYQSDGAVWAAYALIVPPGGSDGEVLTKVSGAPDWAAAGGGGSSVVPVDKVRVTSGNITLNQTAITGLSAFDLSIPAASGDELEVHFGGRFSNVNQIVCFDVYTMNGGTRVNPIGPGLSASLSGVAGVSQWTVSTVSSGTAEEMVGGAAMPYTVQAGDIFSGNVALRLHYAKLNTTARTLYADASVPAELFVKNLGH